MSRTFFRSAVELSGALCEKHLDRKDVQFGRKEWPTFWEQCLTTTFFISVIERSGVFFEKHLDNKCFSVWSSSAACFSIRVFADDVF